MPITIMTHKHKLTSLSSLRIHLEIIPYLKPKPQASHVGLPTITASQREGNSNISRVISTQITYAMNHVI